MNLLPVAAVAILLSPTAVLAAGEDHPGKEGYNRCAACHLAQGQGIPGAFPPLKGRIAKMAALPEGRRYLVEVVNHGLSGSITVNNTSYFGTMPAQSASFDAAGISQVLNYSIQILDRESMVSGWTPYTPQEVEKLSTASPNATAQTSAQTRAALAAKHPQLF